MGEGLGQGRDNAKTFLREHADISSAVEAKIKEATGLSEPLEKPEEDAESNEE